MNQTFRSKHFKTLILLGLGINPISLGEALKQKLFESVIYNFLTISKYVYPLTSNKKIVICTLTGVLRGVSNWPVKICCAYFGHIHNFFWVLFIFYHVRCQLNFGHWFNFWGQQKFEALWLLSYFGVKFWPCFTGHFISRASARRSACALL